MSSPFGVEGAQRAYVGADSELDNRVWLHLFRAPSFFELRTKMAGEKCGCGKPATVTREDGAPLCGGCLEEFLAWVDMKLLKHSDILLARQLSELRKAGEDYLTETPAWRFTEKAVDNPEAFTTYAWYILPGNIALAVQGALRLGELPFYVAEMIERERTGSGQPLHKALMISDPQGNVVAFRRALGGKWTSVDPEDRTLATIEEEALWT